MVRRRFDTATGASAAKATTADALITETKEGAFTVCVYINDILSTMHKEIAADHAISDSIGVCGTPLSGMPKSLCGSPAAASSVAQTSPRRV